MPSLCCMLICAAIYRCVAVSVYTRVCMAVSVLYRTPVVPWCSVLVDVCPLMSRVSLWQYGKPLTKSSSEVVVVGVND